MRNAPSGLALEFLLRRHKGQFYRKRYPTLSLLQAASKPMEWRATIRDHMPELFEPGQPGTEDQEQLIAQLHQKIGQLTVDLDWLKKKSKQLGL
jgi:hypothetical protein